MATSKLTKASIFFENQIAGHAKTNRTYHVSDQNFQPLVLRAKKFQTKDVRKNWFGLRSTRQDIRRKTIKRPDTVNNF